VGYGCPKFGEEAKYLWIHIKHLMEPLKYNLDEILDITLNKIKFIDIQPKPKYIYFTTLEFIVLIQKHFGTDFVNNYFKQYKQKPSKLIGHRLLLLWRKRRLESLKVKGKRIWFIASAPSIEI